MGWELRTFDPCVRRLRPRSLILERLYYGANRVASGCRPAVTTSCGRNATVPPVGRSGQDPCANSRVAPARGSLAGSITIGEDFEFSDEEIDAMLDEPE